MSLRILFLVAEPWPTFRADVAVLFGKWCRQLGIVSDLVASERAPDGEATKWPGGDAFLCRAGRAPAARHLRTFLNHVRQLLRARSDRYSAIQVRDLPLPAAIALLVARSKGLRLFYWMSYPMPEGQIELARERGLSAGLLRFLFPWVRGRVGRFLLYRVVLPRADHIFVQSERMKQGLIARGIAAQRMTPVPMGVDLEAVHLDAIPPSDDPRLRSRRVLVYLGTLDRPRRIEVLFAMLAEVKRRAPRALLVLAGDAHDDAHRIWLRERARAAGVDADVIWTGWLPMHEGWRYVRAAEVALSPIPRGELLDVSSPTKVPEYLALGVPVVCNDNPDQAAAIHDSSAGRCVPYTAQDFGAAVLELLDLDAAARAAMARAARQYVAERRDYRVIAEALVSRYRALLPPAPAASAVTDGRY